MARFLKLWNWNNANNAPDSVLEVDIKDYTHYEEQKRDGPLRLYFYTTQANHPNFEVVLHQPNNHVKGFSLLRSNDHGQAHRFFQNLSKKLPVYVERFPYYYNDTSRLQELCDRLNSVSNQNLAHVSAFFGEDSYFEPKDHVISEINQPDGRGASPLHIAVERQHLNVINVIINLPGSPFNFSLVDKGGNNVLHVAAKTDEKIIATLCDAIEKSTNPNAVPLIQLINTKNSEGFTPLYLACAFDKSKCAKELLSRGADVNGAAMHGARNVRSVPSDFNKNKEVINNLDCNDMKKGGTPLHWCKSPAVIEILIESDCDMNAKNFEGETALNCMIRKGNVSCIVSLLTHGADINQIDENGNTPLHLAIKTKNKSLIIVKLLVVFGANVDKANSRGITPRHLVATSAPSAERDKILYVLHSVSASRCKSRTPNCADGCSAKGSFDGIPPENFIIKNVPFYDRELLYNVIKINIHNKEPQNLAEQKKKKKVKLLCLDGGGIRGLILIQILFYLEMTGHKKITEVFDWIAGTSTGGILAMLLCSGYSVIECRKIYFSLKDKIFVGNRPYSSEIFESFLRKYLGENKKLSDIKSPKVLVPATKVDYFPPEVKFYRNYKSAEEILQVPLRNDFQGLGIHDELLWKVGRATGAAPTYFNQFEVFIDGALMSNNPTLDLLTEIQCCNRAYSLLGKDDEKVDIGLVVSLGTGDPPKRRMEKTNSSALSALANFGGSLGNIPKFWQLIQILIEQSTSTIGLVTKRAQAWCSMINTPYFRINPSLSEDVALDENDDEKLVNILWETMAYIHLNSEDMSDLLNLLID